MSNLFEEDGCVVPNIALREYVVTFGPKCEHSKFRSAEIRVTAPTESSAIARAVELIGRAMVVGSVRPV